MWPGSDTLVPAPCTLESKVLGAGGHKTKRLDLLVRLPPSSLALAACVFGALEFCVCLAMFVFCLWLLAGNAYQGNPVCSTWQGALWRGQDDGCLAGVRFAAA